MKYLLYLSALLLIGCSPSNLAQLDYRAYESHGGFNYIDDLVEVFGSDTTLFKNLPQDSTAKR